ncbi:sulfate adenylyltransferase subunit 1 [Candidatus Zinderia endosymbiont of Aphrophora alni]|uniref:sulfate adenylyltransferase subunit 1 n=1 Tax=Candidatus Zinderia endosymbiont of Aphrophora alni TaxID=3077951 RepID=UPI0030D4556B
MFFSKKSRKFFFKKTEILRFITAGSVDDGKSTLIGRLLYDSKNVFIDQINSLNFFKKKFSYKNIDLSLIVDGLEAEQEQGITIDVAYRYFSTSKRKFIIADTPGHKQYTRNMITGASTADVSVILIDASKIKYKKNGKVKLLTQTKRHTTIVNLLNVQHIIIAINKIDLINYDYKIYNKIVNSYLIFFERFNIKNVNFVPISALYGENIIFRKSKNLSWYKGKTLIEMLETFPIVDYTHHKSLRFPIQLIAQYNNYKKKKRGYMGQIKSGKLKINDKLLLLPIKKKVTVKNIIFFNKSLNISFSGNCITIFLKENIDISRGDMLVSLNKKPYLLKIFKANLCWLSEEKFNINSKYLLKHTTKLVIANVVKIKYLLNINNQKKYFSNSLKMNDIANVIIKIQNNIVFDEYINNKSTGSFILINKNTNQTVASGMIKL